MVQLWRPMLIKMTTRYRRQINHESMMDRPGTWRRIRTSTAAAAVVPTDATRTAEAARSNGPLSIMHVWWPTPLFALYCRPEKAPSPGHVNSCHRCHNISIFFLLRSLVLWYNYSFESYNVALSTAFERKCQTVLGL